MHTILQFNSIKATQFASVFLKLNGGKMNYMKLIKLMYIADRKALLTMGNPISTDRYVSMDRGPVLSRIYNFISEEGSEGSFWHQHIKNQPQYQVSLVQDPGSDQLSIAESDLVQRVDYEFKEKDQWEMVDYVHTLPEWVNPNGSAIPIEIRDILLAENKTLSEIELIEAELGSVALMDQLLSRS